jgi:hypothetical protein
MAGPYTRDACVGSGTNSPAGVTVTYYQARKRTDKSPVNVYLDASQVPQDTAVFVFYNPEDGACYEVFTADPRTAAPGDVLPGWEDLTARASDQAGYCGVSFYRARKCSDGTGSSLWKRDSDIPALPYVFKKDGVCYIVDALSDTEFAPGGSPPGPLVTGETVVSGCGDPACTSYVKATSCLTSAEVDLWLPIQSIPAFPSTFKKDGLCYVFTDVSTVSTSPGPVLTGAALTDSSCGTGECVPYRQAYDCDTGTAVNLWLDDTTLGTLPKIHYDASLDKYYVFATSGARSTSPGMVLATPNWVNGCRTFMQARSCLTGSMVNAWKDLTAIVSLPSVYKHGDTCYRFETGNTTGTLPGSVITGVFVNSNCGTGSCTAYRQAKNCDTNAAANLWLDDATLGPLPKIHYEIGTDSFFIFDSSGARSETPGTILASPNWVAQCRTFRQAKSCLTNSLVPVWRRVDQTATLPAVYRWTDNACYLFEPDNPTTSTPSGTLMTGGIYIGTSCGTGSCVVYRQATRCLTGLVVDLWIAEAGLTLPYTFKFSGACYTVTSLSPRSENPGTIATGVTAEAGGCGVGICERYLQLRSSATGLAVNLWIRASEVPDYPILTAGGPCNFDLAYFWTEAGCYFACKTATLTNVPTEAPGPLITGHELIGSAVIFNSSGLPESRTYGCRKPTIKVAGLTLTGLGTDTTTFRTTTGNATPRRMYVKSGTAESDGRVTLPLNDGATFTYKSIYSSAAAGAEAGYRYVPQTSGSGTGTGYEISLTYDLVLSQWRLWLVGKTQSSGGSPTREVLSYWSGPSGTPSDPRGTYGGPHEIAPRTLFHSPSTLTVE